jgi:hypothetical protein
MTEWDEALRQLTREAPDTEVKNAVLNVMRSRRDDRSAALIMSALVDTSLGSAIAFALGIMDQKALKATFLKRGPLSTFDSRCIMACSVGITGNIADKNLEVIRLVRNTFAHAMVVVDFNSAEVVRACNRLKLTGTSNFFVDRHKTRKSRYQYGYGCSEIFQAMINFSSQIALGWIDPGRPKSPVLP